jgi:hypothetical protein
MDAYDYIPSTQQHARLVDDMGRIRAYAYAWENSWPIPHGWHVVQHVPVAE